MPATNSADLTVWAAAAGVLVVNGSSKIQRIVRSRWPSSTNFESPQPSLKVYGRAIRMHQWLKNLLLLVPALAAHQFNVRTGAVPDCISQLQFVRLKCLRAQ